MIQKLWRSRALGLIGFSLSLGVAGCSGPAKDEAKPEATPAAATEEAPAILVSVEPVRSGPIEERIEVTGSLVALQDVVVGAKSSGRLITVNYREGDTVQEGAIVAQMDSADVRSQVNQAQANLQSAQTREQSARAQLVQAKSRQISAETTLRWTEKTVANAISQAKSSLASSQERLAVVKQGARSQEREQAQENVRSAKAQYDRTRADLKRYQQLFREDAVSQSALDQAQASFDAAEAQWNSAKQALSLVREGARPEEIRQAELAVQQAQEQLARAEADRDQINLRKQDVENEKTAVMVAQSGIETSKAGVDQAKAALIYAELQVKDTAVRAPISGTVAKRFVEPGAQLGGGGQILRIVAPGSVTFDATLSESEFAQVRNGQSVAISVDALPNVRFSGRVASVLPVASASARTFTLRVAIDDKDARLRPEMFARGSILVSRKPSALLVPKSALVLKDAGRASVFVLGSDNTVTEAKLTLGIVSATTAEALQGVSAGAKVVTDGKATLQSGDKVRLAAAPEIR